MFYQHKQDSEDLLKAKSLPKNVRVSAFEMGLTSMHMDLFRFLEFRSCLVLCMRVDKASYTLCSNHRKRFKKTKCLYYRAMPKALIGQGDASAGKGACPRGNNSSSMTWKERADSSTLSYDLQLYVVMFSHPFNQSK